MCYQLVFKLNDIICHKVNQPIDRTSSSGGQLDNRTSHFQS